MWKRFAKIEDGIVVSILESKADQVEGFIDVTGRDVRVDGDYDADTDTFTPPNPDARQLTKALVLIIKAAIQEGVIPLSIVPQEAKDIWQEIKDNRL